MQTQKQKCVCSKAEIWAWDNTRPSVCFLPQHIWFNLTASWMSVVSMAEQKNNALWSELSIDAKPDTRFNAWVMRKLIIFALQDRIL